jgi:hypothetical protein
MIFLICIHFILSLLYFYSKNIENNYHFKLFIMYLNILIKVLQKLTNLYISIIEYFFFRGLNFLFSYLFIFQYFDLFWRLYLQMMIIICLISFLIFPLYSFCLIFFKYDASKLISSLHLKLAVLLFFFFSNQTLMVMVIISDLYTWVKVKLIFLLFVAFLFQGEWIYEQKATRTPSPNKK